VTIGTQYLVIPHSINEKDIRGIINRFKEIKPDYLAVKPYSDHPLSPKDLIVDKRDYERLEKIFEEESNNEFKILFRKETARRVIEGNNYPECYGLSFISLIDSKGNVLPCNLFYDRKEFTYGNLYEKNFSEIWIGEKRKNILEKLKTIGTNDCRKGCRCDAGNEYLHRIKNPQAHDNFT
jgi:GTP 3',8-cyclase